MVPEAILNEAVREIPDCLGCGTFMPSTGKIIHMVSTERRAARLAEVVVISVSEIWSTENVASTTILSFLTHLENAEPASIKEHVLHLGDYVFVLMRRSRGGDDGLVFVCRGRANIAMTLATVRMEESRIWTRARS